MTPKMFLPLLLHLNLLSPSSTSSYESTMMLFLGQNMLLFLQEKKIKLCKSACVVVVVLWIEEIAPNTIPDNEL